MHVTGNRARLRPALEHHHVRQADADIGGPACAIDEQTAIVVVDGSVEVGSEGRWVSFTA